MASVEPVPQQQTMDQNGILQSTNDDDNVNAFNDTVEKIKDVNLLPLESMVKTLSNGRRDSTHSTHSINTAHSSNSPPHSIQSGKSPYSTNSRSNSVDDRSQDIGQELVTTVSHNRNSDYNTNSSCSTEYGALVINEGSADSNDTVQRNVEANLSIALAKVKQQQTDAIRLSTEAYITETTATDTERTIINGETTTVAAISNDTSLSRSPPALPTPPEDNLDANGDDHDDGKIDDIDNITHVKSPHINGEHIDSLSKQRKTKRKLSKGDDNEQVAEKRLKVICDVDELNALENINEIHDQNHQLQNDVMGTNKTLYSSNIDVSNNDLDTTLVESNERTEPLQIEDTITESMETKTLMTEQPSKSEETTTKSLDNEQMTTESSETEAITAESPEAKTMTMDSSETEAITTESLKTEVITTESSETKAMTTELDETEATMAESLETKVGMSEVSSTAIIVPVETESIKELTGIETTTGLTETGMATESTKLRTMESKSLTATPTELSTVDKTVDQMDTSRAIDTDELFERPTTDIINPKEPNFSTVHTPEVPLDLLANTEFSTHKINGPVEDARVTSPNQPIPIDTSPVQMPEPVIESLDTLNTLSYMNGCENDRIDSIVPDTVPIPPTLPMSSTLPTLPLAPVFKDKNQMKHYLKRQLLFGTIGGNGYANDCAQRLGLQPAVKIKCFKCDAQEFESLAELKDHQLVCLRTIDNNNLNKLNENMDTAPVPTNLSDAQGINGINTLSNTNTVPVISEALSKMSNHPATVTNIVNQSIQKETKNNVRIRRQVFLCAACGTYYEKWHLFYHIREVHKKFICLFCLGIFNTAERLVNHLESKHIAKPNVYEHKEGLIKSLKNQCYLMCCVCEHIFSECDDFTGHSCENYMAPCSVCSLKFIHKPSCSFAIKNKAPVKKTLPIATKPMMAAMEYLRPSHTKKQKAVDGKKLVKNGEIVTTTPVPEANHVNTLSGSDSFTSNTDTSLVMTLKINRESPSVRQDESISHGSSHNSNPTNVSSGNQNDTLSVETSGDEASSDDESPDNDSESNDNSDSGSEQSPVKEIPKLNSVGPEPKVQSLKLKLTNIRRPQSCDSSDSNSNSDSNDESNQHENVAFQIENNSGDDEVQSNASSHAQGAPLLVPKLKLKLVKDFKPAESEESSTESDDGEANDEELESTQLNESVVNNSSTDQTTSSDGLSADVTGESENQTAVSLPIEPIMPGVMDFEMDSITTAMSLQLPDEPAAIEPPTVENNASTDCNESVDMDIDVELSAPDLVVNVPPPQIESMTPPLPQEEFNEIELEQPIEDTPNEELIEDHRPISELILNQPLDKMPVKQFIRKCLSASFPTCLYCNHARKIAVDGSSLAQHLVSNHRFLATVDSITAEELLPSTIEQRISASVDELVGTFFNLDSYDYKNDEPQPQPFIKNFECLQCRFQSLIYKDLYLHNRKMHLRAALICLMCRMNFFSYSELLCHMCPGQTNKMGPIDLKFRCVLCNLEDIPSAFRLMVHLRKKHFACDVCLEECHDQSKLSCHVWKHKLHHLCYRCNITYRNKADITKHLFWKHGTESVLCKRCLEKKWPHVYHFCVPPTKFTCDTCSLVLPRAVALKVHKRLHAADSVSYPCSEDNCEKSFISRKLLLKHVNRHYQPIEPPPVEDQAAILEDVQQPDDLDTPSIDDVKEMLDVKPDVSELVTPTDKEGEEGHKEEVKVDEEAQSIGNEVTDKPTNEMKDKKQKKKGKLTDLIDLPTPNLSESDSSDDSDNESSAANSVLLADNSMPSFSPSSMAQCESQLDLSTSVEEEDGQKSVAPIVDIWENFKTYQASQLKEEKSLSSDDESVTSETLIPPLLHVNQSDHDYCLMYKPITKLSRPATEYSATVPAIHIGIKGEISIKYREVTPERLALLAEVVEEPVQLDKDIAKTSSVRKQKLSGSESSSDSSDSDSSCSNCNSNCSCSSSSSGSSSSSSDSDSDSSTANGNSPKKNLKSKKVRDEESSLVKKAENEASISTPSRDIEADRDRLKSEMDVVDVDIESTDVKPIVVNTDPDSIINESDLETAESETDEDFYDEHPQKMANQLLAEKRRELLSQAHINPYNIGGFVENSRPSTPSLPEEVAREHRIKVKKRKKDRKTSKHIPMQQKTHISNEPPAQMPLTPPINTYIVPDTVHVPTFNAHVLPSANAFVGGVNSFVPFVSRTPPLVPFLPGNALETGNTPGITGFGVVEVGAPKMLTETRKYLASESRMSTGSSCSDADGSSALKRSKRRRIPNKFYGYTSDEESAGLASTSVNSPGAFLSNPFKPIPPPNLTWSKEDLPQPPKIVSTPSLKTIIRLPTANNTSTPKSRKSLQITKPKPKPRNRERKTLNISNTPKSTETAAQKPLIPPLIIRSNSVVKMKPQYEARPEPPKPKVPVNHPQSSNSEFPVRVHIMPIPKPSQPDDSDNSSDSESESDSSIEENSPASTNVTSVQQPFVQRVNHASATQIHNPMQMLHTPPAAIQLPTQQSQITNYSNFTSNPVQSNQPSQFPLTVPPVGSRQAREGESVYCYCRCPYDEGAEMIACDGDNCPIEWFHFVCVGILVAPQDKWYCPQCSPQYVNENKNVDRKKSTFVPRNFMNHLGQQQLFVSNTFQQQLPAAGSSSSTTPSVT